MTCFLPSQTLRRHESPPDSSAITSQWTTTSRGVIHSRTGAGKAPRGSPPVILVHGLIVSSRYMVPTAELLAPLCRVFAPDLPGYGKSDKSPRILNLIELADALAEWMEALGVTKAHLVANSFGCQILADFALRHAEKADRLVLQGPTVDPAGRSLRQQLIRLLVNSRREQRSMGRITAIDYASAGWRRIWATVRLALQDEIEKKLPHIQAPTLVVRGERDAVVPQIWAEQVAKLLPKGTLHVIPGAAHTVNYSAPRDFVRAIRPFLDV